MLTSTQRLSWKQPAGYAGSHCRNCAMGWTRVGHSGEAIIICLLDREQALADMTSCDRHISKQDAALTKKDATASSVQA